MRRMCSIRAALLLGLAAMPASAVPLPLVCEVTSEEVPTISIRLEERTPTALRGVLIQDDKRLGIFMSSKPKQYRQTTWSFFTQDAANSGTALLFENDLVWNPHKRVPKPQDVNRVIFVGLDNALKSRTPESSGGVLDHLCAMPWWSGCARLKPLPTSSVSQGHSIQHFFHESSGSIGTTGISRP